MNNYFKSLIIVFSFLCCLLLNACSASVASPTITEQAQFSPTITLTMEPSKATEELTEIDSQDAPIPEIDPLFISAPDCEYGGSLKSIEAVDDLTIKFTMCKPDPLFLEKIAHPAFAIHSSEYLNQTGGGGKGSALLEKPIGTGPYKVSEWSRDKELIFKENSDYWNSEEAAKTPTLIFRWNPDPAQRLLDLQAGIADGIDNPDFYDYSKIIADGNLLLITRSALKVYYLGINNTSSPFDTESIRQAVAIAIDRQRIVENFFPPGYEVASHFTPCSILNGCEGEPWYEFEPSRAKELLSEAGFPDGFPTVLAYYESNPESSGMAQDIKAQLKENLNIDVTISAMEASALLDAANSGTLPGLHLLGWGADYPDITNFLDFHFGAGASAQFGEKFDDIIEALTQGAALVDDEARKSFYETANNAIKQHVPMIPIAHGGSGVAFKAVIEGAHASPLGNEVFSVMSVPGQDTLVWVQIAEPNSLYCADETDVESLRACQQVFESLYKYEVGGASSLPNLAKVCKPNEDLTVWTCTLNEGVLFHDGSALDANDVVMSYLVQWDASHPLHKGNTGAFTYFNALWGPSLNAPAE
jgi:peptide/nickel transport system substrate-binding protein